MGFRFNCLLLLLLLLLLIMIMLWGLPITPICSKLMLSLRLLVCHRSIHF